MRNKTTYMALGILTLLNVTALQAGTIQVLGSSEVSHAPDSVSFTINIHAQCYDSIDGARQAADQKSSELFKDLNKLFPIKDKNNQISTHGGYTQPFHGGYRPRNAVAACENTFQKNTQITVKTSNLNNFEDLFNQTQDLAYRQSQPTSKVTDPITFVTMNQPNPQLSAEKYQRLEKQAIAMALQNAEDKAQYLIKGKNIPALKMIAVNESLPNNPGPIPMRNAMKSMAMMESTNAPIQFQDNIVRKQLSVIFEY
tara:strand:- start:9498 stop:10262 length:765 start_codon:yes stop_codon:yes gene_type:complete